MKQIKGLERVIAEHQNKIETEKIKAVPDLDMIKYWEKEIEGYKTRIIKANKRLKRGR